MKITIKTLQQKVFQIDAESSETVGDLKQKILSAQGHAVESQKLIYSGKVLVDNKTIESCEIKEKDFLVLMVSKPKPTPTPAPAAAPATASSSTPAAIPVPPTPAQPATTAPVPAASTASATATPPTSAAPVTQPTFGDMSTFLTGPALEVQIGNMVDMGFPREEVLRALRASFNNPDRAVEYLMNGIPETLLTEQSQPGAPAPAAAAPQAAAPAAPAPAPAQATGQPQNLFQLAQQQHQGGGALGGGAAGAVGGGIDVAALRNNPQLAQLREMVHQNPALLQPLVQQLAHANPQLAQLLTQHPEALMQLLGGGEGDDAFEGEGGEGHGMPPPTIVNITEEERAAIQRLEALGFSRQEAIQAYLVCDKNEELAANYLFDNNGFED
ncbi:UV excision repair protein Rad23 [Melanogaster broomeanus]|nr:UV excision repair protein Rad23 [Melanogaster broomeanus]